MSSRGFLVGHLIHCAPGEPNMTEAEHPSVRHPVQYGLKWALDYSVFTAFGQALRESWMHPVATGLVLIGGGEFVRSVVNVLGHRAGEPPVEVAPAHRMRSAA